MINSYEISKSILKNAINDNKLSHAYLFQIDDSFDNNELVFSFVKDILCPNKKNKNHTNCNICRRIDEGNYPELKVICPDGMWIKKEQLIELQNSFNRKAVESDYLVYVIKEAEKMNKSAANTILKFLEEPESGIIAILVTNNIHNVIETIVSRCQIINLKKENIRLDYSEEMIDNTFNFICNLEQKKVKIFSDINELWINKFSGKEEIISFFEIALFIYTDVLNYYLKGNFEMFQNKQEILQKIISNNNQDTIYKKINFIMEINEQLKYNVNTNMLLDKFIIEFSRGE